MVSKKIMCQATIVIVFYCSLYIFFFKKPVYQRHRNALNTLTSFRGKVQDQNKDDKQVIPKTKPLLTMFTTWVSDKMKNICRNNTVQNWNLLHKNVIRILFTNETDLTLRVKSMGWKVLPVPKVASTTNVPVLKDMFYSSFKAEDSTFYAYANGDNLFTDDLIKTLKTILKSSLSKSDDLLLIGRRTDVRNVTKEEARNHMSLKSAAYYRGSLHSHYAIDFLIIKKSFPLLDLPDLVIGRPYVDSFIVSEAVNRVPGHVIDITLTSLAVHQVTLLGKKGIDEGSTHPDKNYNYDLLKSRNPNYSRGNTNCAHFYTYHILFDKEIAIAIKRRRQYSDKRCFKLKS
ncbi:uncharacterized protein LOC127732071 [Mytilus californianus]|uniref:uncharacterized protein LOC127732071 n=1 Tax=Mytilus californianus TaxID=6549 RepID=UPI002247754C|nr:uncharacterized protein LOC127732071 [Mytilus californianus]